MVSSLVRRSVAAAVVSVAAVVALAGCAGGSAGGFLGSSGTTAELKPIAQATDVHGTVKVEFTADNSFTKKNTYAGTATSTGVRVTITNNSDKTMTDVSALTVRGGGNDTEMNDRDIDPSKDPKCARDDAHSLAASQLDKVGNELKPGQSVTGCGVLIVGKPATVELAIGRFSTEMNTAGTIFEKK